MSHAATYWAFAQQIRPATVKFVLVSLADAADQDGVCFPSIKHLCEMTCLDRKTVISALDQLEAEGLLVDTAKRVGRTGQVKVYRLNGMPSSSNHYVYRVTDDRTGEFYIGVRSCFNDPKADNYLGNGAWPMAARKSGAPLRKEIIASFSDRKEAEAHQAVVAERSLADPLCRNVRNEPKGGTVPKAERFRSSAETVPIFPSNSTDFPTEESRKRDTEPVMEPVKEPTSERERARRATHTSRIAPQDFEPEPGIIDAIRRERPDVDVQAQLARFRFHEFDRPRTDWQAAFAKFCLQAHRDDGGGALAWSEVLGLLSNSAGAAARAGPRVNAAVRAVGGWQRLGHMPQVGLNAVKPSFLKAYADVAHG